MIIAELVERLGYAESENYLRESIHRSLGSLVNPDCASIALDFQYSNLGELSHYQVVRSWTATGKQLKEALTISRDGQTLPEVSSEQCQGFLRRREDCGAR